MGSNFLTAKLRQYKAEMASLGDIGLPMRIRLFCFFLFFLTLIMVGVLTVLFASGIFVTGEKESRAYFERELARISDKIYHDYGSITVQAVELAERLSANLERQFLEQGISADKLQDYPELLESFLAEELDLLTATLEKTRSSGAYIVLDATVNPELEGAEYSRAGLYIKNMEPNIVNSSFNTPRFLLGPMSIARNKKMDVLPQWKMEFQVEGMECYAETLETARERHLPLSRLYKWSQENSIADYGESVMLCSVPLVDSNGQVFGICGFEVSSMLFKLSYSPDDALYNNLFCIFSPLQEGNLRVEDSLFAGSYRPGHITGNHFTISEAKVFHGYGQSNSASFAGLHQSISLYPQDSAYQEQWLLALMMPEQELERIISGQNIQIIILLSLLAVLSIVVSFMVSRGFVKPVEDALEAVKSDKISQIPKTKIPEIDDLIKFLAEQDADLSNEPLGATKKSTLFRRFVENIDTLSAAERAVFNLYLKGYTAQEITEILCLSINTIKTHNKRIYMKLNVSSRKELMLYIQMLEEQKLFDKGEQ